MAESDVNIQFPPGLYDKGTSRLSQGRWELGNGIRFFEDDIRPIGGWSERADGILGAARAILTWRDNDGASYAAIGTHTHLFIMTRGGTLHDVTPENFTPGRARDSLGGGYGSGNYGEGLYGQGGGAQNDTVAATTWSLSAFGEVLIATASHDGAVYEWSPDPAFPAATAVTNAPTARYTLVTPQRSVMALGAASDPRQVSFSDTEDRNDWTATNANRAGDIPVQTNAGLIAGVNYGQNVVLFTQADAHLAVFLGAQGYGIQDIPGAAGIVAPNAVCVAGQAVYWMGRRGFWVYNGVASPLACAVTDRIFGDLNTGQLNQIFAFHNREFGEIWWFYPSASSPDVDSYVSYSYREGHWSGGKLARSAAVSAEAFDHPLMVGGAKVYDHERGVASLDDGLFLEGGPLSLGRRLADVMAFLPDGPLDDYSAVTITTREYPNDEGDQQETQVGIYDGDGKFDFRAQGREADLRLEFAAGHDFRVGAPVLRITPAGSR